jgi:hypothetical protein
LVKRRLVVSCVLSEGTRFNLEINSKAGGGAIHVSSKSCDSNEALKLASDVDCSISGSNPKVHFHVPKLYHNPKVDSEVLKMVLDVNSDMLGSNQKVVIELFLDHSQVKKLLEPSTLPSSFQDVDLLPILEDVDLHLRIWPVLYKAADGVYSILLDPITNELVRLLLDVKVPNQLEETFISGSAKREILCLVFAGLESSYLRFCQIWDLQKSYVGRMIGTLIR